MPSEIKPCPVCETGDERVTQFAQDYGDFAVKCWVCGLTGPDCPTEEEAIAKWNRLHMRPEGVAAKFQISRYRLRRGGGLTLALDGEWVAWSRVRPWLEPLAGLNPEAVAELAEAAEQLVGVIRDSRGVEGYHLNGDVASWDEVGGDTFVAALAKLRREVMP